MVEAGRQGTGHPTQTRDFRGSGGLLPDWNTTVKVMPLTQGKCFLLFLPDSHSAYYDSFVSVLGRSLPPLTGSFKDLLHLDKFLVETEGGVGGGLTHLHLQHWVKWLWEWVWDFSALALPLWNLSFYRCKETWMRNQVVGVTTLNLLLANQLKPHIMWLHPNCLHTGHFYGYAIVVGDTKKFNVITSRSP